MNKHNMWQYLIAAKDDPVLAAWAFVCKEQFANPADVSPYDALEAYQQFFDRGIISAEKYNATTVDDFFGRVPSSGDVQDVLQRINVLCPKKETELMSFFQKKNALTTKTEPTSAAPINKREPLSAFSPAHESLPPSKRSTGLGIDAFSPNPAPQRLNCQTSENPSEAINFHGQTYTPHVYCGICGEFIKMRDEGPEILPEDGDIATSGTLLVAVFSGRCQKCGIVHHCSINRDPNPDSFR